MKTSSLLVLALIGIFLLMGAVSADYYNTYSGMGYPSFAVPLTCEGCMKDMSGKTVNLNHILREQSQVPSTWCVEKGGPANVVTFNHRYDIVYSNIVNTWAIYTIKMTLNDENQVQNIQFFKNSVPVQTIPAGLWNYALKKLV